MNVWMSKDQVEMVIGALLTDAERLDEVAFEAPERELFLAWADKRRDLAKEMRDDYI
jgi:hypothetical protein